MRILFPAALVALALTLSACAATAPPNENLALLSGPVPQIEQSSPEADALACVNKNLTKTQRGSLFAILEAPDRTGHVNISGSGDAFGYFNTQGGADMLPPSLKGAGVRLVDISPSFRGYEDWQIAKANLGLAGNGEQNTLTGTDGKKTVIPNLPLMKGTVLVPDYIITGSIDGTDFVPGGGLGGGIGAVTASYSQNRIAVRIDLRVIRMSTSSQGGEVIATTTVTKQIVQDTVQLSFTRFVGPSASSELVSFDIGGGRREPMELSTGAMFDLAAADLVAQVFKVKKCEPAFDTDATGQVAQNGL